MHLFESWFRERFGATPPLGYRLREDHRPRWLRLHSLPESKRYADNDAERVELRMRASAAASEILPTGSPVWLVSCLFGEEPDQLRLSAAPSLVLERAGRYADPYLVGPCIAYAAQTTWPHRDFEQFVDAIAEDAMRAVWFSSVSGEAFAPYDGGIDLIVETPQRAEALRQVFPRNWLSPRPDGL